ncbi:heat shock 70 kDa protein 12A-like [Mizuhopecten yessoensis]|uniref:Heat shock 70 kDa protein n=1 Tax=Mizuhopecten yessoensis TaxID=6573 RepID=A0A1C9U2W7_MIZYE|nr:heat shock 70 kDa protein 12A-like [Mizuhopecten yessoensis]AOR17334.1 heat shock 70 kDa protein [Mizuhopecten yessoensis]OWF54173.1 Heat shock 70 kDa protein 12A [Mizuhopecten yessoensis]
MATQVDKGFIVAAIDLGTTYSSHAFSYKSDYQRDPLHIHTEIWEAGNELSHKTSSVILLNPDKSFNSFGFEAEKEFTRMAEEENMAAEMLGEYYYIDSFKMRLYQETENDRVQNDIRRDTEVDDIFGKPISLVYLIETSILYLKTHLLDQLNSRGFDTTVTDVRWVITVPAVWTDQAKQIMRECAFKAGIPSNTLTLAYEPEVAALFCNHLPADQLRGADKDIFKEGERIMVVDLGGGTADVTVQEVSGDKMRSIFTVSGGPWGGSKVNAEFISFLIELFGNEVIRRLQKNDIEDYLELIREFEVKKRNTSKTQKGIDLSIRIPTALREKYEEFHQSDFKNAFTKRSRASNEEKEDVTLKKDKMNIKPDKVKRFFSKTISNITEHLTAITEQSNASVSAILMVGGFSECKLVSDAIKEAFPDHHVIIPMECDLSVIKGAVLYGHRPESITARYCHYSIGISLNKLYDPNEHVGATTFKAGKTVKCGNCFETFFRKGRIVEVGEKEAVEVHSDHRGSDREKWKYDVKEIEIFTSNNAHTKFVTDAGCNRHAIVTIDPPEGGWSQITDGKIEMEVGGTEINDFEFFNKL